MKFGIRIPSLKKRISARLSWKRYLRHSVGLKAPSGMGLLTNPKKAIYNKIYNKTTIAADDLIKPGAGGRDGINLPSTDGLPVGVKRDPLSGEIIRSSSTALNVTSENFIEIRTQIDRVYAVREELQKALRSAQLKSFAASMAYWLSLVLIVGFFFKVLKETKKREAATVETIKNEILRTSVRLTFADGSQLEKGWLECIDSFKVLMGSVMVWDVTYAQDVDGIKERTVAKAATKRTRITKRADAIGFIESDLPPLAIPNANGPDVFVYPGFLILFKNHKELGIFDLKEIEIDLKFTGYIEEEAIPGDAEVVGHTWKKANKDGSMDKRFKGNYQIPILRYGLLELKSQTGLQESYMFSGSEAFLGFKEAFEQYLKILSGSRARSRG